MMKFERDLTRIFVVESFFDNFLRMTRKSESTSLSMPFSSIPLDIGKSPIRMEDRRYLRSFIGRNLPENKANGEMPCVRRTALAFVLLEG